MRPWLSFTVNPRISSLGANLFLMPSGWGLIRGGLIRGGLIRGGLIKLFDKFRIKSSLPKLLFSILLQEQGGGANPTYFGPREITLIRDKSFEV